MTQTSFSTAIGDIPWPEDPRLQRIAEHAGLLCFFRFPYFPLRFGERGRAFAIRDAGYLVHLQSLSPDEGIGQAHWLSGVLATRGMPAWLLEVQLVYLIRLLRRADYPFEVLHAARGALARARRRVVDEPAMTAAGIAFAHRAALPQVRRVRETGMLIAAAYADEVRGLATSQPLLSWMTDAARFPLSWRQAVDETYGALSGAGR